jgi:hypothetical protein
MTGEFSEPAVPYDPNKPTLTNYISIPKVIGAARNSGVYKADRYSTLDKSTTRYLS